MIWLLAAGALGYALHDDTKVVEKQTVVVEQQKNNIVCITQDGVPVECPNKPKVVVIPGLKFEDSDMKVRGEQSHE